MDVPGIGFTEMLLLGVLALLVVGPKDLPLMMRKAGRFIGRLRDMATDFRHSFDELARQTELDELRREVDALKRQSQQPFVRLDDPIDDDQPREASPTHAQPVTQTGPGNQPPDWEPGRGMETAGTNAAGTNTDETNWGEQASDGSPGGDQAISPMPRMLETPAVRVPDAVGVDPGASAPSGSNARPGDL